MDTPRPLLPPPGKQQQIPPLQWPGNCTAPAAYTAPRLPDAETARNRGNPGPPTARSPVPPGPLPPFPARGRAAHATTDSHTAPAVPAYAEHSPGAIRGTPGAGGPLQLAR